MTMLDVRMVLKARGLLDGNEHVAARLHNRRRAMAKQMATPKQWFQIRNADADEAEVWIYDEISWWGITAADFARDLRQITAPKITVRINSPGGDVFDGIAVMNALKSHPASVTTRVDALAASIASVIAQGGDHRVMVRHSQMMIHDAWGMTYGNAAEVRSFADLLDKVSANIADIYAERSGKHGNDAEGFRALMLDETWLDDSEAVELGLADEVVDAAPGDPKPPADADEDEDPAEDAEEPDDEDEPDTEARARNRVAWLSVFPNAMSAAHKELV